MSNKFIKGCITCLFFSLEIGPSWVNAADNWQDLAQPIGNLVRLWSSDPAQGLPVTPITPAPDSFSTPTSGAEEVNYISAQWDPSVTTASAPFETTVSITEITPSETLHFVRMYTQGSSSKNGPWMVRSSEVRGLTPEQIRDRLALPLFPDSIISVDFPPSPDPATGKQYALWTGIAGPIIGFGEGGALQSRIIANASGSNYPFAVPYTYDGIRYNSQPLGPIALAYSPLAGGGNPGVIAAYLDQFVPAPYSDLETVYTSLDFLNWIGFDPPLPFALDQISPECYGCLPVVAMRNSILFSNSILERYFPLNECQESCEPKSCRPMSCNTRLWVQGVIESGDQKNMGSHPGFDYATYGAVANVDFQPFQKVGWGFAGSWLANNVHFDAHRGGAHINSAQGGLYASYVPSCFFINTLLSGGYNWTSAHRTIDFPIETSIANVTATGGTMLVMNIPVDRRAHSHQRGYDLAAHLQTGFNFHRNCWWATPLARVSYFYERNQKFHEHGADSLNLNVHAFDAQDIRTNLGVGAARIFSWGSVSLIPQIQMMWIHDFVLNNNKIQASLEDLGESFTVKYFNRGDDSFFGGACLKIFLPKNIAIFGFYEIETGEHFISNTGRLDFRLVF